MDEKRSIYTLESNADFASEVERRLLEKGLTKNSRIILICRSGDRSARAADLLGMRGFKTSIASPKARGRYGQGRTFAGRRLVNGWKNANLPWSYKLEKAKINSAVIATASGWQQQTALLK